MSGVPDTETGMQAFCSRRPLKGQIRHANVSVPNDDYLSGDSVIYGLEWQIDTVTVDLDRCSDIIEMVTTSTLARSELYQQGSSHGLRMLKMSLLNGQDFMTMFQEAGYFHG